MEKARDKSPQTRNKSSNRGVHPEIQPLHQPLRAREGSPPSSADRGPSRSAFFNGKGVPVQANLRIGTPNDKYEQEADAMANRVMSGGVQAMTSSPPPIQRWDGKTGVQLLEKEEETLNLQRQCADCAQEDAEMVQRSGAPGSELTAPGGFSSKLSARSGHGQALPDTVRNKMESGFGHDFSDVSIHTDGEASKMSGDIGARAFTHGRDIYFKSGEYNPNSGEGQRLLAHELTHTVQQGAAGKMVQKKGDEKKGDPCDDKFKGVSFSLTNKTGSGVSPFAAGRIVNAGGKPAFQIQSLSPANYQPKIQIAAGSDAKAQEYEVGLIQNLISNKVEYTYAGGAVQYQDFPVPVKDGAPKGSGLHDKIFAQSTSAGVLESYKRTARW